MYIFRYKNSCILIEVSLFRNLFPRVQLRMIKHWLVQIMDWHRADEGPLSESNGDLVYRRKYASLGHLPLAPNICISESGSIGSDNGLSPIWRQAIILTNAGLLSIRLLGTNFNHDIKLFSHENASENIVCEVVGTLSRGRWVNIGTGSIYGHDRSTSVLSVTMINVAILWSRF